MEEMEKDNGKGAVEKEPLPSVLLGLKRTQAKHPWLLHMLERFSNLL